MSRLVLVVPLKDGAREEARSLLAQGPPFDLEATDFDRHEVFLTECEVVFVFESRGSPATLRLPGEDPRVWKAAAAWQEVMAERPRKAETVYAWRRLGNTEAVFFDATPGPGDSDGGDVFAPVARGSTNSHDEQGPARAAR
jgi:hypothetical protein